jgi:hypothetical protein
MGVAMNNQLTVHVGAKPETVGSMLVTDQFTNLFQVRYSQWITWSPEGTTHIIGKIPYLRSKNLSAYRFHVHLEGENGGSRATITTEEAAFFLKNKWIVYAAGLMMCCVGVVFPIVGLSLLEKRIRETQADIAKALATWSQSQGAVTPVGKDE